MRTVYLPPSQPAALATRWLLYRRGAPTAARPGRRTLHSIGHMTVFAMHDGRSYAVTGPNQCTNVVPHICITVPRCVEGSGGTYHHDRHPDRSAVVHLRLGEGVLPPAPPPSPGDARVPEEEAGAHRVSRRTVCSPHLTSQLAAPVSLFKHLLQSHSPVMLLKHTAERGASRMRGQRERLCLVTVTFCGNCNKKRKKPGGTDLCFFFHELISTSHF